MPSGAWAAISLSPPSLAKKVPLLDLLAGSGRCQRIDLAALLASLGQDAASAYSRGVVRLVAAGSEIAFTTRQMGVPVDGKFKKWDAQVAFDPKKPEAAKIGFTVELGSASIGTPETEAELAKPDWFNTKAFPQATFQSTPPKAQGGGKF